jgi:hypothetical protein
VSAAALFFFFSFSFFFLPFTCGLTVEWDQNAATSGAHGDVECQRSGA